MGQNPLTRPVEEAEKIIRERAQKTIAPPEVLKTGELEWRLSDEGDSLIVTHRYKRVPGIPEEIEEVELQSTQDLGKLRRMIEAVLRGKRGET